MMRKAVWLVAAWLACAAAAAAAGYVDVESGFVFGGYNDVRIPPEGGTELSLTDDLETDSNRFLRLRAGVRIGGRHEVGLLIAPLRLRAEGTVDRPVHYRDVVFPAGQPLEARYRFDSYRVTWRYALKRSAALDLSLGLTAKIRDAEILVEGGDLRTTEENTGFVPLISFGLRRQLRADWDLLIDGDALAAPGGEGRAEDLLLAVQWRGPNRTTLRLGYRLLEGGADVEDVYNFALIHYLTLGIRIDLQGRADVQVLGAAEARPEHLSGINLLLVGSPTRGFRPVPEVVDFLKRLPHGSLNGVRVAAFDTRIAPHDVENRALRWGVRAFGYAADPLAGRLRKLGGTQAVAPEGFQVRESEGPLKPEELDRAACWARQALGND